MQFPILLTTSEGEYLNEWEEMPLKDLAAALNPFSKDIFGGQELVLENRNTKEVFKWKVE